LFVLRNFDGIPILHKSMVEAIQNTFNRHP